MNDSISDGYRLFAVGFSFKLLITGHRLRSHPRYRILAAGLRINFCPCPLPLVVECSFPLTPLSLVQIPKKRPQLQLTALKRAAEHLRDQRVNPWVHGETGKWIKC